MARRQDGAEFDSVLVIRSVQAEIIEGMARSLTAGESPAEAVRSIRTTASYGAEKLRAAVRKDMQRIVYASAQRQVDKIKRLGKLVGDGGMAEAARLTDAAYAEAKLQSDRIILGMSTNSAKSYVREYQYTRKMVNLRGERAMIEAVQRLAECGVYAYTYTDKNGRLYRVPADVGMRRTMLESGLRRQNAQALSIAKLNGQDLIKVEGTVSCRESHQAINAKIFSISGADKRYPAWSFSLESLTHDYGCQHSIGIYFDGYDEQPTDPLEGTDYTPEEAREAVARQRSYENAIRKQKRARDALEAAGMDTTEANARIRKTQAALREHVASNDQILKRQRWREQDYTSNRRTGAGDRAVQQRDKGKTASSSSKNAVRTPSRAVSGRAQMEAEARAAYVRNGGHAGLSAKEANERFDKLIGAQSDAQLRAYVRKHGKK